MCQSGLLAISVTQHTSGTASCYEQAAELLPLYMLTMNMLTMNIAYEHAAYNHAANYHAAL